MSRAVTPLREYINILITLFRKQQQVFGDNDLFIVEKDLQYAAG